MEARSVSMTPEFHRGQAERCRRIAAERRDTDSARRLIMQAVNHDRVADILIELDKINTRLPRATLIDPRANARVLH